MYNYRRGPLAGALFRNVTLWNCSNSSKVPVLHPSQHAEGPSTLHRLCLCRRGQRRGPAPRSTPSLPCPRGHHLSRKASAYQIPSSPRPHLDGLCCQVTEEAALRVADAQRAARPQVRELKAADRRGVGVEQHALDVPAQVPHLHPESRGRAVARRSSRGRPSRWRPSRGQREKRWPVRPMSREAITPA